MANYPIVMGEILTLVNFSGDFRAVAQEARGVDYYSEGRRFALAAR